VTDNTARTTCRTCVTPIAWIDCPTGGWWAHDTHPADEHDALPAAWADDDPLMERIASEVWEHCRTEGTSLVVDDPRNIAAVAAAVARAAAEAAPDVDLPARLEATLTERYTELGNPHSRMRRKEKGPDGWPAERPVGPHHVTEVLRELLAAEAQQDGPR
jgi:hypothetical protein